MIISQIVNQSSQVLPTGIGVGSVIAAICSWERNRSIVRAIIAAMLSWIYVIYFALTRLASHRASNPSIPRFPLEMRRDRKLRPPSRH
jgi:hypothetical protein